MRIHANHGSLHNNCTRNYFFFQQKKIRLSRIHANHGSLRNNAGLVKGNGGRDVDDGPVERDVGTHTHTHTHTHNVNQKR